MQFRMGSHALPVEQGRLAKPAVPGISAVALCAGPGHWGMNGILFLTALVLPKFVASRSGWYHTVLCVAQGPEGCLPLPSGHSQFG